MSSDTLAYDDKGLVTVVVQDRLTGEVRMVAHADAAAVNQTIASGQGWFWSRKRQSPWKKGESSGHVLEVHEVWTDCDRDAVVYLVDPHGPTCHTGTESCFSAPLLGGAQEAGARALPFLFRLEESLARRATADAGRSYTRSLLDGGASKIGAKLREEADEMARALDSESDARVTSEAADLVYHALVGLLARKIPLRSLVLELARRFGTSGHAEKAARTTGG